MHSVRISKNKQGKFLENLIKGAEDFLKIAQKPDFSNVELSYIRTENIVNDFLDDHESSLKDLIVIHDDIDMNFGRIRIRKRGGHGGHKGVQSIIQTTGGKDFIRLKVGVGRPGGVLDVTEYVLHPFEREERVQLGRILSGALEAVEMILLEGVEGAMRCFNAAVLREKKDK